MFDNLSDKLQRVFKNLRGEGKLTPENMESALREIRVALLEADRQPPRRQAAHRNIKQKAMGEEVLMSLFPPPSWRRSRNFPETISSRSAPICELTWPG